MAENELGALSSISNLSSEDIKGKGVDYYRDLGKLISPAYERPTGAEIAFNFFSGMSEVASQPGSTFGGSLGGGARKAGDYLFKDNLAGKKRERELGLTGLKLANVMGKGKKTKSMVVVGDFVGKSGELIPLGSTYNPTDKEITNNPTVFSTPSNKDMALLAYASNFPDKKVLTSAEAAALDIALSNLGTERVMTVTDANGNERKVIQSKVPRETLQRVLGGLYEKIKANRKSSEDEKPLAGNGNSGNSGKKMIAKFNSKTREWGLVEQ